MASNTAASSSSQGETTSPTYQDEELCKYLLSTITTTASLEILPSNIHHGGTGLFASQDIPQGAEIFRSKPLVHCLSKELNKYVCDYCHTSSDSRIRPDGKFRKEDDVIPKISLCTKCKFCGYCSKDCQAKAWNAYHRFECQMYKRSELTTAEPKTRMLHRLLSMHKHNSIAEQLWLAINNLESHQAQLEHAVGVDAISQTSRQSQIITKTEVEVQDIKSLFCRISTNSMAMLQSSGEVTGSALDITSALLNHCCDPNAFVFSEGNELRMRSLKHIQAGEEITHSYVCPADGIVFRKKLLVSEYFFNCQCSRCQDELEEFHFWTSKEGFSETEFAKVEQGLFDFQELISEDAASIAANRSIEQIKSDCYSLTQPLFSNKAWPDTLWPMPSINAKFTLLYQHRGDFAQAATYALRSTFGDTRRVGPEWVWDLVWLIHMIHPIVVTGSKGPWAKQPGLPDDQDLWTFYRGLLFGTTSQANQTFGADTKITRAIGDIKQAAMESASPPKPARRCFAHYFDVAQTKLLQWAGVDVGLKIEISE